MHGQDLTLTFETVDMVIYNINIQSLKYDFLEVKKTNFDMNFLKKITSFFTFF